MKLVLGPRDLFAVLERGADQVELLLGLGPRVAAALDQAELLLGRVAAILDRVELVAAAAATEAAQVEVVIEEAHTAVKETDIVIDLARPLVDRLTALTDSMEPSLTRLQPTLEVLADTTDPGEVAALVSLVDQLPGLTARVEHDVLPVMDTLKTVAPDLRDLLTVSRELNEIIGKVPGFGRIKRRVEEEQEDDHGHGLDGPS